MPRGTPTPTFTLLCEAAEDAQDYYEQAVASQLGPLARRIMAVKLQRLVTLAAANQDGVLDGLHRLRFSKPRHAQPGPLTRRIAAAQSDDDPTRAA